MIRGARKIAATSMVKAETKARSVRIPMATARS
jgi:hypothetical protein